MSDFQRFYGVALPIEGDADIGDLARAALLWSALPDESRCVRRCVPQARWTPTDYLLRDIENHAATLVWRLCTKDGQRGVRPPEPRRSPAERAEAERRRDAALGAREEIDRILGM